MSKHGKPHERISTISGRPFDNAAQWWFNAMAKASMESDDYVAQQL